MEKSLKRCMGGDPPHSMNIQIYMVTKYGWRAVFSSSYVK